MEHKRTRRSPCLGIEGWQTWKFGKWGLQLGMLVIQAVIWVDIPGHGKIEGNPWKETCDEIGNWQFKRQFGWTLENPEYGKIQGNPWKETNGEIADWQFKR